MIVPDLNLLIYAIDSGSPHHERAAEWWLGALRGRQMVGLAWAVSLGFVRLTTNPRIFAQPLAEGAAFEILEQWAALPQVVPLEPTSRHLGVVRGLLSEVGTAGNLVADAHLAALAVEHGAELHSADADFSRFRGLRWVNPLAVEPAGAPSG